MPQKSPERPLFTPVLTPTEDEINFGNQFAGWTPRLLKAAYNYHLVNEDPGGFMHNAPYIAQLMYDSIANLSEASAFEVSGLIRPE